MQVRCVAWHTTTDTTPPPPGAANSDTLSLRQLVTPQAAEIPAVTDHTTRLVQVQFAGRMVAEKARYVIGWLQRGVPGVTLFATEGIVDFGVADDAIRHLGHASRGDLVGFGQSAMTGLAGILRIQMAPDVARGLKVSLLVNRCCKNRRQIPHFEMLGVAKCHNPARRGCGNLRILMALAADGLGGQQIVGCLGAGGGRSVAGGALQFQAKVELMREGRGR
jgi:hypothetical protein